MTWSYCREGLLQMQWFYPVFLTTAGYHFRVLQGTNAKHKLYWVNGDLLHTVFTKLLWRRNLDIGPIFTELAPTLIQYMSRDVRVCMCVCVCVCLFVLFVTDLKTKYILLKTKYWLMATILTDSTPRLIQSLRLGEPAYCSLWGVWLWLVRWWQVTGCRWHLTCSLHFFFLQISTHLVRSIVSRLQDFSDLISPWHLGSVA